MPSRTPAASLFAAVMVIPDCLLVFRLLEMQFRRLLTCPPVKLDEADHAPVGPGVFLLTDSDLTSYYYVEACQTLRIAVAISCAVAPAAAARIPSSRSLPIISESPNPASQNISRITASYAGSSFDEGASHFAHFVIAVLRPILNE